MKDERLNGADANASRRLQMTAPSDKSDKSDRSDRSDRSSRRRRFGVASGRGLVGAPAGGMTHIGAYRSYKSYRFYCYSGPFAATAAP